jgi:GH24 family phage-related lysozyme (muramidase)
MGVFRYKGDEMRERLASAVNSSTLKQKEATTSVDLIGAMGIAAIHHSIGMDAVRFIDGLQAKAYRDMAYSLTRKAGQTIKCDKNILFKVSQQVIHESAFSFCKACQGRKEMMADKHVIKCQVCQGTGLHRHTDMQRAKSIGLQLELYLKHWARIFDKVNAIYTSEVRNGLRIAKQQMEAA